ncbi:hypothetical protein ACFE04_020292 [Oxalis oulophora]
MPVFSFPNDFLFGTASSSYQYEGGYLADGKGLSNWDVYSHFPGNIIDGTNGDVAVDHYHRYLGRFGGVNIAGIDFYNKLIDALLLKAIQPFVTLTHMDSPQELEDRYGSWLSPEIQKDFGYFADICFRYFGDRGVQRGSIGIVLHAAWFEPVSNSNEDKKAVDRAQAFSINWFLDPTILGKYPDEMTDIIGSTLPKFSSNDLAKLKKGLDFIGINHYTSYYVQDCMHSNCKSGQGATKTEGYCLQSSQHNGVPIGETTDLAWQSIYPHGMKKMVNYVKDRYNNIPMFITENGFGEVDKMNSGVQNLTNDVKRVNYMESYLDNLLTAMREGADVRGYFAWSVLDNFEWKSGYTVRFGLHHVDYDTLKRTPKLSANWYKQFITNHKRIESQKTDHSGHLPN